MTTDLFTTTDISKVRTLLIKEQGSISALSGLPLEQPVLDHLHDIEQFVRGVINSKENVALGRIEGLYGRYIGYWYKGTYPEFLRLVADYIERGVDRRFRHNGWLKKALTEYNKLSEGKKDLVLAALDSPLGKNGVERKKNFSKALMTRKFSYNTVMNLIKKFR
jgi:hypothetical protein